MVKTIARSSRNRSMVFHIARLLRGSTPDVHSSTRTTARKVNSVFYCDCIVNHVLFDPLRRPMASCSFRFWPPDKVAALAWIFAPKSQSRSSCSRSSLRSEFSDHLTDFQTRRVCKHVSSGNKTFFCGTIPSAPLRGR